MAKIENLVLKNGTKVNINTTTRSITADGNLNGLDLIVGNNEVQSGNLAINMTSAEAADSDRKKKGGKTRKRKSTSTGDGDQPSSGSVTILGGVDKRSVVAATNNREINQAGVYEGRPGSVSIRNNEYKPPDYTETQWKRIDRALRNVAYGYDTLEEIILGLKSDKIKIDLNTLIERYGEATREIQGEGIRSLDQVIAESIEPAMAEILSLRVDLRRIMQERPLNHDEQAIWDELEEKLSKG